MSVTDLAIGNYLLSDLWMFNVVDIPLPLIVVCGIYMTQYNGKAFIC